MLVLRLYQKTYKNIWELGYLWGPLNMVQNSNAKAKAKANAKAKAKAKTKAKAMDLDLALAFALEFWVMLLDSPSNLAPTFAFRFPQNQVQMWKKHFKPSQEKL